MRWERLFDDLEAQLAEADRRELADEVAERSRAESSRVRLVDRVRAAVDRPLRLQLLGPAQLVGQVRRVGSTWLLLQDELGREAVVVLAAVTGVYGLPAASVAVQRVGLLEARLGLPHVLRGVSRDRAAVTVGLVDGTLLTGTVDRVGADHVDLSEHGATQTRRRGEVDAVRALPLSALGYVRRT